MTKGRVVATVVVDLCYPYDMPVEKARKILSDTYVEDIKAKLTDGLSFKHETVNVHGQYADLYRVPDEMEDE